MIKVMLVSTFEGGYQPMTVATAATPLLEAGFEVSVLDTYVDGVQEERLLEADLVAIAIPVFMALQSGIEIARLVRQFNPTAHITFFGQYATINSTRLVGVYSDTCVTGEWEEPLVALARHLSGETQSMLPGIVAADDVKTSTSQLLPYMSRKHFRVPSRHLLPPLYKYPQSQVDKLCGSPQIVGGTEIARGCHHKCLYCSVFAAYGGKVLVIPEEIVQHDVRNLIQQGMTHLSFIDADFFNAKYHGINILRNLHAEFPDLTYDFTTRVDHILENKETIREMRDLNVRFITSALEFPSETVLDEVAKFTSIQQIEEAIDFMRQIGILLNPTFIMFNPWTNLEDLVEFRAFVEHNGLDEVIDPIQYETRLHLYKGSPLLQSTSIQALDLEEQEFHVDWKHPDPRVDELFAQMVTPPEPGVFKRCCLKC